MHLQLSVVFVALFQIVITEKCITPNNEEAECVPISSCEILIDALFKAEQSDINEFVQKSKCEGRESDRMVCCGSTSRFSAPMINKSADKNELLPDRRYCGYQHSDDYFRNETVIGINEFPWLAVVLYKDFKYNNETIITIGCSGSLISNRYVLTAAYCISIPYRVPQVAGVRLGEYNITTAEDCTEDSGFYECSEPPQYIGVEKIIPHPQFKRYLPHVHDIGLLRLSKRVQYSDYIRPICLPTAGTMFAKPGDILLTSGWGAYEEIQRRIKKKIYSKLVTNEECQAAEHIENRLCAKDLENNTDFICDQDLGAPLIFSFRKQWHQEGVSLFNLGCKKNVHFPMVYTKVVNYLDWIKENMEP